MSKNSPDSGEEEKPLAPEAADPAPEELLKKLETFRTRLLNTQDAASARSRADAEKADALNAFRKAKRNLLSAKKEADGLLEGERNASSALEKTRQEYRQLIDALLATNHPVIKAYEVDLLNARVGLLRSKATEKDIRDMYDILECITLLMNGKVPTIPNEQKNAKPGVNVMPLKKKREELERRKQLEIEAAKQKREEEIAEAKRQTEAVKVKPVPKELNPSAQELPPPDKRVHREIAKPSEKREDREKARVHIRWMIRRDMPEVLKMENDSFEFAWTEEDFLRCLRQRNCIGMVAEHGEKVVGYMIYELFKSKLHIMNFAVDPQWRRLQVGAQMVEKLISKLSSHRRTRVSLELRETNLAAQMFFFKNEFRATRVLRNFYSDSGEDAFIMEYRFGNAVPEEMEEGVNRIAKYEEE